MITRSGKTVATRHEVHPSASAPEAIDCSEFTSCQACLGDFVQVKADEELVAQPANTLTPTLHPPPTPASPCTSPGSSPILNGHHTASLDSRSGTEGHSQKVSSHQEASHSQPQDPVTPPTSQSLPIPVQHQQAVPALVLVLDNDVACSRKMLFGRHSPAKATVKLWKENQQNAAMYSLRLIGNALKPEEPVGIDPKDLRIHSKWAARLYGKPSPDGGWHDSSTKIVLPVQTPFSIVYEMVQALYQGRVTLRHDNVEHLLLLAHAMKVALVKDQCRTYLLELDLPLQQLPPLCMLWGRLAMPAAFRQTLQRLMNRPWLTDVVQTISALFKQLVHADASLFEMAKKVLQDDRCGSMCELQVLDMLLAADVSLADPLLPTLFRVGRVADTTFSLLEKIIRPDGQPQPSSQLLIEIASRGSQFASWSSVCAVHRESLVLISVEKDRPTREKLTFRFHGFGMKVQLPQVKPEPSADGECEYKLAVKGPQPTAGARVVLYFITDATPAVTPMCQWNTSTGGPAWVTQCGTTQHSALQLQLSQQQILLLGLRVYKQ